MWDKNKQPGFTIVELLIVIVVIGILAAITVVAYGEITARAKRISQQSQVDEIGKAIRLYANEQGLTGAGAGSGTWYGALNSVYSQPQSMRDVLIGAGYLKNSTNTSGYLIAPCTDFNDQRRVVLFMFNDPAPSSTVAEQLTGTGCANGTIDLYSGSTYNRNYARVY